MEKEQIIDYVTNTPGNSNAAVLRGMLDQIKSSDLPSNENANEGDVLTVGENHVNEWTTLKTDLPHYYIGFSYNTSTKEYADLGSCYVGEKEIVEDGGRTLTLTKIVESDKEALFAFMEYLRGVCLLSAYVVENTGNTRVAEIVDCAFDFNGTTPSAYITFNLTSENHYNPTQIANDFYPALLLRFNIFPTSPQDRLQWVSHIGGATPVLQLLSI